MSSPLLWRCLTAVATAAVLVCPLGAQETTGSLSGKAFDSSGAVLPGVLVEISGVPLQGTRTSVTGNDGRYRFLHLPPGDGYNVNASLDGFAATAKKDIHIFLGQEGTSNLQLVPATQTEITVSGESPLVDVTRTTTGLNITARQFDALPTTRSYQALTAMAPGVSMELGERRRDFADSPSVGASTPPENNYIIEGLSTTGAFDGLSGTRLTMNFVEEVQVLTGGYSAEFGRSTGGIFNVVTKSGSNKLRGDVFAYYQNPEWSARNVRREFRGTSTRADGIESKDAGFSVGGPIARDRLWFFTAYDPTRKTTFTREFVDRVGQYVNEEHEFDTSSEFFAGKLTWSLRPQHQVVATVFGDPTVEEGWLGSARAVPDVANRRNEYGGLNSIVRYSGMITNRTIVEARAGRHQSEADLHPITDVGWSIPLQYDNVADRSFGGFFYSQDELASRRSLVTRLSHDFSQHELSLGIDIEHNRYQSSWNDHLFIFNGPTRINAAVGVQDQMVEFFSNGAGTFATNNEAAFIESRWRLLPRFQINAGIRYERQILDSPNDVFVASSYLDDGSLDARKVNNLRLDRNWAPRLGLIWNPRGDGTSKVYGFLGRYFEAIPLSFNLFAASVESRVRNRYYSLTSHTGETWHNPTGSPVNGDWILYQTLAFTPDDLSGVFDEHLQSQYQDEYLIGYEHQFAAAWSAGIRLVNRRIGRVIEDFGIFNDPDDPYLLTSYVIGNPSEREFGQPFQKPKRDYNALELTLQRRRTDNWQLQSSFVYARARGDYEGVYLNGYNQLLPNNQTAYYDLPALQENAFGRLPADRPYQLKIHSSYTFPIRLTVSEGFSFSAGSPVSAYGPEIYNGYGDGLIFLTPRGSEGRTENAWTLDLHAQYVFPVRVGGEHGLSVIFDVFNATNNHAALVVDQNYIYEGMPGFDRWTEPANLGPDGNPRFNANLPPSPYFKTPLVYQSPRSIQLGMKLSY